MTPNLHRNKAKYPPEHLWKFLNDINDGTGSNLKIKDMNQYTCWNPEESLDHRITKWMVFDILTNRGHKLIVEKRLGGGIFDLLDCTEQIIIEIETKRSEEIYKKKLRQFSSFLIKDIKIIYIPDISTVWETRYNELTKIL